MRHTIKQKEGETMELRVLRYFLAVAREENITAAAESLHVRYQNSLWIWKHSLEKRFF